MPANCVGARGHDIRLVISAMKAETELIVADAVSPIRLRRHAHGAHADCTETLRRLVLLDVVVQCELRATDRRLLVYPVCRPRHDNATCLCRRSAKRQAKTRRNQCQRRAAPIRAHRNASLTSAKLRKSNTRCVCFGSASIDAEG